MPNRLAVADFAAFLLNLDGERNIGRAVDAMDGPLTAWLQATRRGVGYVAVGLDGWARLNYQFGRTVLAPLDAPLRDFVQRLDAGGDRAVSVDECRDLLAQVWAAEEEEMAVAA